MEAGRILWRCRRGTRELDVLLERYVRHRYPYAPEPERAAFAQLLELPDPELADYLLGQALSAPAEFAEVVRRIGATPASLPRS